MSWEHRPPPGLPPDISSPRDAAPDNLSQWSTAPSATPRTRTGLTKPPLQKAMSLASTSSAFTSHRKAPALTESSVGHLPSNFNLLSPSQVGRGSSHFTLEKQQTPWMRHKYVHERPAPVLMPQHQPRVPSHRLPPEMPKPELAMLTNEICAEMRRRAKVLRESRGVSEPSGLSFAADCHATIMIEMCCRPIRTATSGRILEGFTTKHDMGKYQRYFQLIRDAVGDSIESPLEECPMDTIDALVELTPEITSCPAVWDHRKDKERMSNPHHAPFDGIPSNVPFRAAGASRLGAFEVYLVIRAPGQPEVVCGLFSKLWTRKWPNPQRLVNAAQRMLTPTFKRVRALRSYREFAGMQEAPPRDPSAVSSFLKEHGEHLPEPSRHKLQNVLSEMMEADSAIRKAISSGGGDIERSQGILDRYLDMASEAVATTAYTKFADSALRHAADDVVSLTTAMERFSRAASSQVLEQTQQRLVMVYDDMLQSAPCSIAGLERAIADYGEYCSQQALEEAQWRLSGLREQPEGEEPPSMDVTGLSTKYEPLVHARSPRKGPDANGVAVDDAPADAPSAVEQQRQPPAHLPADSERGTSIEEAEKQIGPGPLLTKGKSPKGSKGLKTGGSKKKGNTPEAAEAKKAEAAKAKAKAKAARKAAVEAMEAAAAQARELGVGTHVMQGDRSYQEDRVVAHRLADGSHSVMMAVYDGHCGDHASEFASHNLHVYLGQALSHLSAPEALRHAFHQTSEDNIMAGDEESGTTAVVCMLTAGDSELHIANVGDSRAVLCRGGKASQITTDHKPDDEVEYARIVAAGGEYDEMFGGVVAPNGGNYLKCARSLGDAQYKVDQIARRILSARSPICLH